MNSNHFQLAMLAYNLNCWLMLFNREPQADATALRLLVRVQPGLATQNKAFIFNGALPRWAPTIENPNTKLLNCTPARRMIEQKA